MIKQLIKWLNTPPKTRNERWAIEHEVLDAYLKGCDSIFDPRPSNPYPENTIQHTAWNKGHEDSEHHLETFL